MPPIRIGVDISCLVPQPLTGVGYYTLHLLQALAARKEPDIEARLFASSAQPIPAWVHELERRFLWVRTRWWPTRLKHALWLRFEWPPIEWFTGPVDIAHGGFDLLPAARCKRRMITVFDLSAQRHPEAHVAARAALHKRMLDHAAARASAIMTISQSAKRDIVELLAMPEDRVHVVYGGVFTEEFERPLDEAGLDALLARFRIRRPYLLHLGTLEPRKNLPRLIEAYARLRERRPDAPQLVLAGREGWMFTPVFDALERHGVKDAVVRTGYLTRAEAVLLLRGAQAFVYPSLYEGFGLPVLEAMAAGVPVLTSNASSLPEVTGDAALLVDPANVEAISAGLGELAQGGPAVEARVEAARARARQFTWDASAEALAALYRRVKAESP